ncbi:MAG: hypothetical protein ChlgKO_09520 [Chlamydiales bacterium]
MTNSTLTRDLTSVVETSMFLGACYTDADKYFYNDSSNLNRIANIFIAVANITTNTTALLLQNRAMKSIGKYTNKLQPSTSAASAGYAMTRIIANRGEGILKNSKTDNGKEALIALVGSIAIFAMEVLGNNTNKLDFTCSFLFGVTTGCCKSIFDKAVIDGYEKITETT